MSEEVTAIEEVEQELQNADSIGDTRLSKLFHEARTTSNDHWQTVSAFCNIIDGELTVDHLDKLSAGRWSPETRQRYDVIISVGIRPFMRPDDFKDRMKSELWNAKAPRLEQKS